jgi:hypothetical protein
MCGESVRSKPLQHRHLLVVAARYLTRASETKSSRSQNSESSDGSALTRRDTLPVIPHSRCQTQTFFQASLAEVEVLRTDLSEKRMHNLQNSTNAVDVDFAQTSAKAIQQLHLASPPLEALEQSTPIYELWLLSSLLSQ